MAFVDVVLADVELESAGLPIGSYVFQLNPGAAYRINKFTQQEELNVSATVATGDLAGRVTFFSYPDPSLVSKNGKSMAWSAQALKKLEISLGVDSIPGEDPATYLNRVASNGAARFSANILAGKSYVKDGKTIEGNPQFGIFSVGPAA